MRGVKCSESFWQPVQRTTHEAHVIGMVEIGCEGGRRGKDFEILSQDFEILPPAAALATNLHHADYVSLVCGSLDRLPEAFAALDAPHRSRSIAVGAKQSSTTVETASLSTIDRKSTRLNSSHTVTSYAAFC